MAKLVFSEDYKHYQIVTLEHAANAFSYKINDPRTFKTLKTFEGYSTSIDAQHAAEREVDNFPVSKAEVLIAAQIDPAASTAILTILNNNYTIVIAS